MERKGAQYTLAIVALLLQARNLRHRQETVPWPRSGVEGGWDLNPNSLKLVWQSEAGSPRGQTGP